ncbi:hypothetical protein [Paractinoplanes durhamensis]|uniref:hypothetical protein n=1 Tax=Paractinoplanes durhamensis TaxID=113563 RepID=UPI00362D9CE4
MPFEDLKERLLFSEALESVKCLDEGVLTSVAEANIGSILGIGYPGWTGGVLQYINGYPGGLPGFPRPPARRALWRPLHPAAAAAGQGRRRNTLRLTRSAGVARRMRATPGRAGCPRASYPQVSTVRGRIRGSR